ncbi:peptide ABC transporter permease [Micromonospora echinospora]|uniref:Peptide/nickel transport system permease protein n=1 Tax=Micromonospora echinospora TaxID=1877 RepID=A0A1C4UW24_MICEC|nr:MULTISPECIES: ABC transporter permease [Micromonospora]OZV75186.1 peptide ABC transporter permease [Micromonospora echinospora]GLY24459.1 peptide ABC transporter permease [Micromonospora sp. NBRC 101691]SCE75792.1 peptide/nickel transport system permease protein [Micromonospora echinospora]
MARFVLSRALKAVLTVWIAITSTFFLLRLLPGDPTTLMVEGDMTPEMQAALLKTYGLDRPLWEQYVSYLRELLQGNLGISFRQIQPVTDIIVDRLPWTLLLAGSAFVITIAIGIPIGVWAAVHKGNWLDRTLQALGIGGHALFVPSVAMLLLVFLGAQLGWFPIGGAIDPDTRGAAAYLSLLHHLVLPVLSLVLVQLGPYALTLRTNMIEVLGEDYIRAAQARGLSATRRVWKHGLRNAILPALTLMGLQLGTLVGGAVLTETVFAYPGVGRLIYEAVGQQDYPVLQGAFIMLAVTVVFANALTDMLYAVLNPRIRL